MLSGVTLYNYTPRCIVIRGENIDHYSSSLLEMKGKLNENLTDKKTGQKFKGYIFPKSLEKELNSWLRDGNTGPVLASRLKLTSEYKKNTRAADEPVTATETKVSQNPKNMYKYYVKKSEHEAVLKRLDILEDKYCQLLNIITLLQNERSESSNKRSESDDDDDDEEEEEIIEESDSEDEDKPPPGGRPRLLRRR